MLSFIFMGLKYYTKAKKSIPDWWCYLYIGIIGIGIGIVGRGPQCQVIHLFWVQKDVCLVVCSCLVAPNARIIFEGLQVVLGLLTYKGQDVGTPRFYGTITHC